jgi:YggT family protein
MIVIQTISILFQVYMLMLFVRILGSWVPELSQTRAMHFLAFYTDPYLNLFRKIIPPIGMIDFSPIVAFIFLNILEKALVSFTLMMLK